MKYNIGFYVMILLALSMIGCGRDSATKHYKDPITFAKMEKIELPKKSKWAEKRGFADFNNDGIEDMIEIKDTVIFGQKYQASVFYGQMDSFEKYSLGDTPHKIEMPITTKWFSEATKMDTGDVNGDGYADIIFTQYNTGFFEDTMYISFAINNRENGFIEKRYLQRLKTM